MKQVDHIFLGSMSYEFIGKITYSSISFTCASMSRGMLVRVETVETRPPLEVVISWRREGKVWRKWVSSAVEPPFWTDALVW